MPLQRATQTSLEPALLHTYTPPQCQPIHHTNKMQESIGFSIPITKMFQGEVVWRGVVYTILMMFGKVITCVWLIQLHFSPPPIIEKISQISKIPFTFCTSRLRKEKSRPPSTPSNKQKNRKNKNQAPKSGLPADQQPKIQRNKHSKIRDSHLCRRQLPQPLSLPRMNKAAPTSPANPALSTQPQS